MRLDPARVNADRITGGPGPAMAKAKTAFRKKHAAVIAATASTSKTTTGPCTTWKESPRSTWAFRSSMASQIHIAGSTWTRVSRQLVTSSFTPSNSITTAPALKRAERTAAGTGSAGEPPPSRPHRRCRGRRGSACPPWPA